MRKGKYPGGPKAGIFDERVWRGGASRGRVEELRVEGEEARKGGKVGRRGSRRVDGYDGLRRDGEEYEGWDSPGRDGVSYRGGRREEMSEGLDSRRTILGEVGGRY